MCKIVALLKQKNIYNNLRGLPLLSVYFPKAQNGFFPLLLQYFLMIWSVSCQGSPPQKEYSDTSVEKLIAPALKSLLELRKWCLLCHLFAVEIKIRYGHHKLHPRGRKPRTEWVSNKTRNTISGLFTSGAMFYHTALRFQRVHTLLVRPQVSAC